jgi:chromosome partitioning protein
LSHFFDTCRDADPETMETDGFDFPLIRSRRSRESRAIQMSRVRRRTFKVLTVASNKGGVGKTTISSNLAVYFRALREEMPILILGFDDQSLLDRMFALDPREPEQTVVTGMREGTFKNVIRLGQYGVHYVPSAPNVSELKNELHDPLCLIRALQNTEWNGLVIIDTKSDLEILTRNAVAASDLVLVPVKNDTSLQEAKKVFSLLDELALPRERARIILSILDQRIKFRALEQPDLLALLLTEIRDMGYPLLESFISGSPKVESLSSNPGGRVQSVLHSATGSIVRRQLQHVAVEVLEALESVSTRTRCHQIARAESSDHLQPARFGDFW